MSMLPAIALILTAIVIVVIAGSAYSRRRYSSAAGLAPALRVISVALAVVIAGILAPAAWQDHGRAGAVLVLAVPVLCGLAAVATDLLRRSQAVITTLSAAVMLFWSLLNGLGPGFYFIIPSLFMVAAAAAAWNQRTGQASGSAGAALLSRSSRSAHSSSSSSE